MSNATLRVITALIAAPVVVILTFLGGWYFGILIILIALAAQWELYRIAEAKGPQPQKLLGIAVSLVILLRFSYDDAWMPMAVALFVAMLVVELFRKKPQPLTNLGISWFGIMYPAVMLGLLIDIRLSDAGPVTDLEAFYLVLAILLLVWITDTAAYYVGKSTGRTPLIPRISPKKTVEGSLGGAAGAFAVAVVLKFTLLGFVAWPHIFAMALIGGVAGQVGDLVESMFKRSLEVKDSGGFLPGHGGFLDRFDAMILAVPLFYLYLRYVAQLI